MAIKTIVTGYSKVEHILPAELLDLDKLTELGGSVVEEFTVEVQRAKLETDHLVRISVPADKMDQFGGTAVSYADEKWSTTSVKKEDFEITEDVEVEDVEPGEPEPALPTDPLDAVRIALRNREKQASDAITSLKARAAVALLSSGMSESEAYVAGSELVVNHSAQIQAFILAGGNPVAAKALLDSIEANAPEWWNDSMAQLFKESLGL